jgi:hypothetical protein
MRRRRWRTGSAHCRIEESEETAAADEARDRENLTALKGNDAAKRFVDELNHAEDQLQATRKQTADLEAAEEGAVRQAECADRGAQLRLGCYFEVSISSWTPVIADWMMRAVWSSPSCDEIMRS